MTAEEERPNGRGRLQDTGVSTIPLELWSPVFSSWTHCPGSRAVSKPWLLQDTIDSCANFGPAPRPAQLKQNLVLTLC